MGLLILADSQTSVPGTTEQPEPNSESFIIDTQGNRSIFDIQQDFISVPKVTLTARGA